MEIGNINANQVNQTVRTGDPLDDVEVVVLGGVGNAQTSGPGEQPQVDGREALAGAEVLPLEARLRAQVPARHSLLKTLDGWKRTAGRALMKFCHVVYNFFTGAIPKRHRRDFEQGIGHHPDVTGHVNVRRGVAGNGDYELADGTRVAPGDVVSYTNGEIGAAMGLDGPADVEPFDDDDVNKIVNGDFHLADIEQDPNLQNCWFLSSLASLLSFQRASSLQKLITIPQVMNERNRPTDADFALVKLGINTYKVPLGDVVGANGERGTSSSKPWVRLLETAMQMHLVKLVQMGVEPPQGVGIKADMNGGSPQIALGALLGLEEVHPMFPNNPGSPLQLNERITVRSGLVGDGDLNDRVEAIQFALGANKPVVLATSGDLGLSLKYGISPGHAVSVQGVERADVKEGEDEDTGHPYLHILDPYGRSVVVDADILMNGAHLFIGAEPEQ